MAVDELEEFIALALTFGVHVLGAALLIWALVDREEARGIRGWWPRDDGPDGRGGGPDPDPEPSPSGERRPLPLPGAEASPVRLREPARIGDAYPRRPRRPEHAPEPARTPERA